MPYLDGYNMYTRKAIDFKLWKIALLLKIHGYYYLPEGKKLFIYISDILNKRYSLSTRNTDEIVREILDRYDAVLATDPPFNVKANMPHINNVRRLSIANRSKNPKTVYIYENNNKVKCSPFSSFSGAHKSLGLKPSSNTYNRYIDTGSLKINIFLGLNP